MSKENHSRSAFLYALPNPTSKALHNIHIHISAREAFEGLVHYALENGGGIFEAHGHHFPLKTLPPQIHSGLETVLFPKGDMMEPTAAE